MNSADRNPAGADLEALEIGIINALKMAPRVEIPAQFAARVASRLPQRAGTALTPGRYGQFAAMACLVALLVLMTAFAHRAVGSSLYWVSVESIFCAQFAVLAVWLVARNAGYTFSSIL